MDPKQDRRASPRILYETPVSQENLDSGIFTYCRMYNYNKDGLYFESDTKLKLGEEIFIGIENSPYSKNPGVYECYHATIRWRKAAKDSTYKFGYGIKFYKPDRQHLTAVPMMLAKKPEVRPGRLKATPEHRKHPRYTYNKSVNYFAQSKLFEGVIKNICRSGAFIQSSHKFKVGEKLSVVLPFIKKVESAMVKGEVIWTNDQGFGVKFKKA